MHVCRYNYAKWRTVRGSISSPDKKSLSSPKRPDQRWASPTSYCKGTGVLSQREKRPRRENNHLPIIYIRWNVCINIGLE